MAAKSTRRWGCPTTPAAWAAQWRQAQVRRRRAINDATRDGMRPTAAQQRREDLAYAHFMAAQEQKVQRIRFWKWQMEQKAQHHQPTPAEFQAAEALRKSPGGPEWIRRRQALTEGEELAFFLLDREATRKVLAAPLRLLFRPGPPAPASPRADAITRAVAELLAADRQAGPRALWPRLAALRGWQIVGATDGAEERLVDAEGLVRITYSQFKKRLHRAKKKR